MRIPSEFQYIIPSIPESYEKEPVHKKRKRRVGAIRSRQDIKVGGGLDA